MKQPRKKQPEQEFSCTKCEISMKEESDIGMDAYANPPVCDHCGKDNSVEFRAWFLASMEYWQKRGIM